ncbi:MAG TPA: hypothetical protein VG962_05825 [Steroidobacteraceae bacterium]|nr:hypothetical protein [Steroidobacteraceae bacterium]
MKTSIEIRAEFLKTLMTEDRNEIRGIRASIYNVTSLLTTASFAITAFILGQKGPHSSGVFLMIDGMLILMLWLFFLRLKRDLYCCRQCLVGRQNLIKALGTPVEPEDFDPFPDTRGLQPDVSDSELWWLPILTSMAIAIKSLIVCLQFV